ncbi:MAG: acetolactate synthase small subunit [Planctomycetota bacterium]|nr:acetolactate synthase small subunit [Planctomycetota bacterium]
MANEPESAAARVSGGDRHHEASAPERQIISVLVKNRPGLLAQVANLFSARGFNIDSLTVSETEDPRFSRMTITVRGDVALVEAIRKGLCRFVDVVNVLDFTGVERVERDLALVKIAASAGTRQEIFQLVEVFQGKVVDIGTRDCIVEIAGPAAKIDAFINIVRPYGIREVARTGRVAMARGPKMEGVPARSFVPGT